MHSFLTWALDGILSLDLGFDDLTPRGKKIARMDNIF